MTDDEHGTEPADYIYTGKAVQVEVPVLYTYLAGLAIVWNAYGGLLGYSGLTAMGNFASAIGQELKITERAGSHTWKALKAVPLDPDALVLTAITELVIPVTFLIVPDVAGKLFSTLPTYLL